MPRPCLQSMCMLSRLQQGVSRFALGSVHVKVDTSVLWKLLSFADEAPAVASDALAGFGNILPEDDSDKLADMIRLKRMLMESPVAHSWGFDSPIHRPPPPGMYV